LVGIATGRDDDAAAAATEPFCLLQ